MIGLTLFTRQSYSYKCILLELEKYEIQKRYEFEILEILRSDIDDDDDDDDDERLMAMMMMMIMVKNFCTSVSFVNSEKI